MKNGNRLLKALMFLAAIMFMSNFATQSATAQCGDPGCTSCATAVMPAPAIAECGCGQSACPGCVAVDASCGCGAMNCGKCRRIRIPRPLKNCRTCKTNCGCDQCPKCEGDICKLELDNSKVKKTCFKTEQKPVCIPPIRFPWMKCCPPGKSKTRLVTKLSTHKYECPNCAYKWSVQKPETPDAPKPAQPQVFESTPVYDSYLPESQNIQPTEPSVQSEAFTPPTDLMPQSISPEGSLSVPEQVAPPKVAPPTSVPAEVATPPAPTSGTSSYYPTPWNVDAVSSTATSGRRR